MAIGKGYSDFLLTGCAILPAMAAAFGQPAFALLSHVVLLFCGILVAGMDAEAPFKQPERYAANSIQQPSNEEADRRW